MHEPGDLRHDQGVLEPLVDRTLRAAALPVQEERKRRWADHQALRPTAKIPVCVYYEGIPVPQWEAMLGPAPLACRGETARSIEFDLRRVLWMAEHVPDDHIVWPSIVVDAVTVRPESWGPSLEWQGTRPGMDNPLEARCMPAPLADGIRMDRLHSRTSRWTPRDAAAGGDRARADLRQMAVHVRWPDLGHSPFDIAARLCGLENVLMWCAECPSGSGSSWSSSPGATSSTTGGGSARAGSTATARGSTRGSGSACTAGDPVSLRASPTSGPTCRRRPLGPRAAAVRGARPASNEALSGPVREADGLLPRLRVPRRQDRLDRAIPNLRRFHVSPWSSVAAARGSSAERSSARSTPTPPRSSSAPRAARCAGACARSSTRGGGMPMDLNLSDIHSVNGRPELLTAWPRKHRRHHERRTAAGPRDRRAPRRPDICCGGTAVLWAAAGHVVKFVSTTSGDTGHQAIGGIELARRRQAEAQASAKVAGIAEYQLLDNHTGELEPNVANRRALIRLIREFSPDLVLSHRPNDYHPDHRRPGSW